MNTKVKVIIKETINLAAVKITGEKNIAAGYAIVTDWAKQKSLFSENTVPITVYHDSFQTTKPENVRLSTCLLIESSFVPNKNVDLLNIEGGRFATCRFEIGLAEFTSSWKYLFSWVKENKYKIRGDAFEIYHNNFNEHPKKKAIVDFFVPVV